ncbi:hypothetical protein L226DRAFT_309894 [Lentinus tigrinus ALCF2SS1-7]|uniref:uncharacterized protein n=1 Tax=Lentinus tigrinus ALCF2SS1-7 TaxID=1328758 RepID=UPI0011662C6D|nr:hypothetical protein L226DRAFT_309894 [Lentinus tigrinus ALCF2SS1-7]
MSSMSEGLGCSSECSELFSRMQTLRFRSALPRIGRKGGGTWFAVRRLARRSDSNRRSPERAHSPGKLGPQLRPYVKDLRPSYISLDLPMSVSAMATMHDWPRERPRFVSRECYYIKRSRSTWIKQLSNHSWQRARPSLRIYTRLGCANHHCP